MNINLCIDYIDRINFNNININIESIYQDIHNKINEIKTENYSLKEFDYIINNISKNEINEICSIIDLIYTSRDFKSEYTRNFISILYNYFDYTYVCCMQSMFEGCDFFTRLLGLIVKQMLKNNPELLIN